MNGAHNSKENSKDLLLSLVDVTGWGGYAHNSKENSKWESVAKYQLIAKPSVHNSKENSKNKLKDPLNAPNSLFPVAISKHNSKENSKTILCPRRTGASFKSLHNSKENSK